MVARPNLHQPQLIGSRIKLDPPLLHSPLFFRISVPKIWNFFWVLQMRVIRKFSNFSLLLFQCILVAWCRMKSEVSWFYALTLTQSAPKGLTNMHSKVFNRKFDWWKPNYHRSFLWSPNCNLTNFLPDVDLWDDHYWTLVLLRLCFLIIGKKEFFFCVFFACKKL